MMIPIGEGLSVVYDGQEFRFCSDLCERAFQATPERCAARAMGFVPGTTAGTRRVAYFSMGVAVDGGMPTYGGGLGGPGR